MSSIISSENPSASPTPSSSPPPSTQLDSSPSAKGKCKPVRGASFTPSEDVAVAKAWIAASENAIVGTEQKADDFMRSIEKLYNESFKPANREIRSLKSLKTRCRAIQKECMSFGGCYARVVRSKPTGVSSSDLIRMATALFNGVDITNASDDCGKPFRFLQAWEVLKTHEKFMAGAEKPESAQTPPEGEDGGTENSTQEPNGDVKKPSESRPVGRRRAKNALQVQKDSKEKLCLASESVQAQKDRNLALKRHYEIMLFTNAPAGCDEAESVEYFNIMRQRALAEIRGENKQKTGKETPASPSQTDFNGGFNSDADDAGSERS